MSAVFAGVDLGEPASTNNDRRGNKGDKSKAAAGKGNRKNKGKEKGRPEGEKKKKKKGSAKKQGKPTAPVTMSAPEAAPSIRSEVRRSEPESRPTGPPPRPVVIAEATLRPITTAPVTPVRPYRPITPAPIVPIVPRRPAAPQSPVTPGPVELVPVATPHVAPAQLEPTPIAPSVLAPEEPSLARPGPHRRRRRVAAIFGIVLLFLAAVVTVIRVFIFQPFVVSSSSMEPTLRGGDRVLVDKLAFHPSGLRAGALVVFAAPPAVQLFCGPTNADLVKRVVALPGQTIWSVGNVVYVNGQVLAQPYLPAGATLGRPIDRQRLLPGEYFVLGDNRAGSCDSRYWGALSGSAIVGTVAVRFWHEGRPDFHLF